MMNEPVFETDRLMIRAATIRDTAMYFDLWTNSEVMKNVGFPKGFPITQSEIEDRICQQGDSPFDQMLVAQLKSSGEVIGECKLHPPNADGIASTDVKLLPAHWGYRYGVEIKRGLVDYLFTHTNCAAVEATPNVNNMASINMQEAVGGVRVGEAVYEFPEAMQAYTSPVHHYIYHVRRQDWRKAQNEE